MFSSPFRFLPADPDAFVFWGTAVLGSLYILVSPFLS